PAGTGHELGGDEVHSAYTPEKGVHGGLLRLLPIPDDASSQSEFRQILDPSRLVSGLRGGDKGYLRTRLLNRSGRLESLSSARFESQEPGVAVCGQTVYVLALVRVKTHRAFPFRS